MRSLYRRFPHLVWSAPPRSKGPRVLVLDKLYKPVPTADLLDMDLRECSELMRKYNIAYYANLESHGYAGEDIVWLHLKRGGYAEFDLGMVVLHAFSESLRFQNASPQALQPRVMMEA